MFDSARAPLWRPFMQFGLVCAIVLAGPWLSRAGAQTLPAGPAATAPASQPSQVVPDAALEAIAANRYADAVTILEPLAAGETAGFEVLVKLAGAYDKLALGVATDRTPAGRKQYAEYRKKAVEFYLRAGQTAVWAGDPRAESIFQRVLRYDPRNAVALLTLAHSNRDVGSTSQAVFYFKEYLKTPEGQADNPAQVELGRLLVADGLWHQAVDVLEKARAVGGAEAEQQLALAYLAGRQAEKALQAVERAVNHPKHTAEAFIVRGNLLLNLGERSNPRQAIEDGLTAVKWIRETIIANPTDEQLWQKAGLWRPNIYKLAETLKSHARTTGWEPAIAMRVAQLISELGDLDRRLSDYEAMGLLSGAARAEDAPADLLLDLAQRQRDIGLSSAAVETAERVLRRDGNNAAAQRIIETSGKPESTHN